jgi:hypothetical protein
MRRGRFAFGQRLWYINTMSDLLDKAVEAVRAMPPSTQDDLARLLLRIAGDDEPVIELTDEEMAALDESAAQAARGEFATDEQVRAVWARHGL